MLNTNLFTDKKDAEIARLKMAISQFKKYDEERKSFYKEKLQRLGELESYVAELEKEDGIELLRDKIQNQTKELNRLNTLIAAYKIGFNKTEEELNEIASYENLKHRNKDLQRRIELLKKSVNQLTEKINMDERKAMLLWHDASERPNIKEHIIVELFGKVYDYREYDVTDTIHPKARWAYMKDLLPVK